MKVPQISKNTYDKICSLKLSYEKTFDLLETEKLEEIEISKGHTYTFIVDKGKDFECLIDIYVSGFNGKKIHCKFNKSSAMGCIFNFSEIKYVVMLDSNLKTEQTAYMQELLDKYYCDFDIKAKEELIRFYGRKRYCRRCGTEVIGSDLPQYPYLCLECDENMFEIETFEIFGS